MKVSPLTQARGRGCMRLNFPPPQRSSVVTRLRGHDRHDTLTVTVIVRDNDTLWDISERTGITLDTLLKANRYSDLIRPGQELDVHLNLAEQQRLKFNQKLVTTAVNPDSVPSHPAPPPSEASSKTTSITASSNKSPAAATTNAARPPQVAHATAPPATHSLNFASVSSRTPTASSATAAPSSATPITASPAPAQQASVSVPTTLDTAQLVRDMRNNAGTIAVWTAGVALLAFVGKTFLETKREYDSGVYAKGAPKIDEVLEERRSERRARQYAREEETARKMLRKRYEDYRTRMEREGRPTPPLDERTLDGLVKQAFAAKRRDEEIARLSGKGAKSAATFPGSPLTDLNTGEWVFEAIKKKRKEEEAAASPAPQPSTSSSSSVDDGAIEVQSVDVTTRKADIEAAPTSLSKEEERPASPVSELKLSYDVIRANSPDITPTSSYTASRPMSPSRTDQEALISALPFVCIVRVYFASGEAGLLTLDIAPDDDAPSDVRIIMFEDRDEANIACLLSQDWYGSDITDARLEAKDPRDARALAREHGIGVLVVKKGLVPFRPGLSMEEFSETVLGLIESGRL